MPITIQNSAGGGVTLDSTTSSNETLQLPSGGGTLTNTTDLALKAPIASPVFTGNVGVAVTPETSSSGHTSFAVGGNQRFETNTVKDGGNYGSWMQNAHYEGSWKYISTGATSRIYQGAGNLAMQIAPSGTAGATISWQNALTIDGGGQVMIGRATAASGYGATFYPFGSANNIVVVYNKDYNGGSDVMQFMTMDTIVGKIQTGSSSTTFATSSDYRLKTDVQPMTGAADRVKLLKPCNFEWIVDGTRVDGFLAHEAQEVVPESVVGTKDAMRDEEYEVTPAVVDAGGNETTAAVMGTRSVPDMQGIDQSKLVPLLTATIQELIARIEALENV